MAGELGSPGSSLLRGLRGGGLGAPPAPRARAAAAVTDGLLRSFPRPGPNRPEPGSSRDPPQHFGGPPPLISPKPQHHSVPAGLWNPVSLMDSSLEPRRAPESHPLPGHPAPFEPSRQAAVPLVKVERVYCQEKADEGPRKREAAPLDKYQPPPREAGGLEHQAFPHGPGPFLAELEKTTQTLLGQQRAALPPARRLRRAGRAAEAGLALPAARATGPRPGLHLRRAPAAAAAAGQQAGPGGAPAARGPGERCGSLALGLPGAAVGDSGASAPLPPSPGRAASRPGSGLAGSCVALRLCWGDGPGVPAGPAPAQIGQKARPSSLDGRLHRQARRISDEQS